jgi:hypothetical protein
MENGELNDKIILDLLIKRHRDKEITPDLIDSIKKEYHGIKLSVNSISKEDKEYAESLHDNIFEAIMKDEASFETKITYISSGAIAMFFTYITSRDSALICMTIAILGLAFLSLCLLSNIASYLVGKVVMRKGTNELRKYIEQSVPTNTYDIINSINQRVDAWNWCSSIFLFLGISFVATFIFINI